MNIKNNVIMKNKLNRLIIEYGKVNLASKMGVSYTKFMKLYTDPNELTLNQVEIINNLLTELDAE